MTLRRLALVWTLTAMACTGSSTPEGPPTRVIIPKGSSFRAAADSLAQAGVIDHPTLFRWYARAQGGDRAILAGTYLLPRHLAWSRAISALRTGSGIINKITIPEGFSIAQIAPLLIRDLGVSADSIDAVVRDSALRTELQVPAVTLEGYLFPDTYMFAPGTSARQAVTEMVRRFKQAWTPAYDSMAAAAGITRHDALTMASIVEKEAKLPAERPVIAGVYYNRLRLKMPLQADPTVQFARGAHTDRVLYKDLEIESPYNTYLHAGLPPGPIASPGAPSMVAALQPATVPYLYFVAAPDGHHEFRSTMAQHTDAIRAIRGEREPASAPSAKSKKSSKKKSHHRSER